MSWESRDLSARLERIGVANRSTGPRLVIDAARGPDLDSSVVALRYCPATCSPFTTATPRTAEAEDEGRRPGSRPGILHLRIEDRRPLHHRTGEVVGPAGHRRAARIARTGDRCRARAAVVR